MNIQHDRNVAQPANYCICWNAVFVTVHIKWSHKYVNTVCVICFDGCVCYKGGCPHCTFRRSYEDLDVPLMTAVQCTEAPSTDPRLTRQVLLNDGRQFVLASRNDSDVATFPTHPSRVSVPHADHMQVTVDRGSRMADDAELPNDLSLRDEALAAATAESVVPPCPVCLQSNFATHMELNLHVNTRHLDRQRADFFE